ncbi:MAG: 4Fe-4S dicluster domain-containing protein [Bradymonadales bacterium]|nr:4Fe-4S dicluster domain-containing protein [Bradymonadales bacterium]
MSDSIVDKVRDAGVVGAGGAGFPTYVKLSAKADIVIANGTECEPMLESDQHLMTTMAEQVLEGLSLAMESTRAGSAIIAIKKKYTSAIQAFEKHLDRYPNVRLHFFESFYPAGDEFVVVYDCTGRSVPEGGLPIEVGVVVQNVATLANIARAVQGNPVTSRFITLAGEVAQPTTLHAPLGTAYEFLLDQVGGFREERFSGLVADDLALVEGGPMMGRVVPADNVVTKTTGGLLVLPKRGPVVTQLTRDLTTTIRRGRSTCDQCRDCTELCPRFLLGHELQPHRVMRAINYGLDLPPRTVTAAVLCCECRLCEAFACPLELAPVTYYKAIKQALREQGWKNEIHRNRDLQPHSMREYRRVPTTRLMDRLGLARYADMHAPLRATLVQPDSVRIPLRMHIGAPAQPVVKVGDQVKTGQVIAAKPDNMLGVPVHASIDGVVTEIANAYIRIERSK